MESTVIQGVPPSARGKAADQPTCVVLACAHRPAPVALLEGLRRRGARVSVVFDAPAALVALQGAQALVVVEPSAVPRVEALRAAVGQYLSHVVCWRFEPAGQGGKGSLLPWDAVPTSPTGPTATRQDAPTRGRPDSAVQATAGRQDDVEIEPAIITPEELAMLVGPLEEEDRRD